MKMKKEHYTTIQKAVLATIEENGGLSFLISQYEAGQFPNADKTKDLSMRFRWDMFNASSLLKFTCDTLYSYLNDDHIDTALRNIIPHKLIKSY